MTSSEDWPEGICCPETCWPGWLLFQDATTCSPQATSWALLEYQMVIRPRAPVAVVAETPAPPPHAATPRVNVRTAAIRVRDVITTSPYWQGSRTGGDGERPRRKRSHARPQLRPPSTSSKPEQSSGGRIFPGKVLTLCVGQVGLAQLGRWRGPAGCRGGWAEGRQGGGTRGTRVTRPA